MLPIIVMTRNEPEFLKQCISSIVSTVSLCYHIYIVDNASTSPSQKKLLRQLDFNENVTVVYNLKNNWVLGLHKTQDYIKLNYESEYFFLTDGDIDFSNCMDGKCWLSYLVEKMNDNHAVGKVGLSLNWGLISTDETFKDIYEQELSLYNEDKKIDELYVSQVDTTATLFRKNWSVDRSDRLYPLHINYLKPELYSCRTPKNINVIHLGWNNYHRGVLDKKSIDEKVLCFTLVGGHIKKSILIQASNRVRLFNKVFATSIKRFWAIRKYFYMIKYCLSKIRRGFFGHTSTNG
ncbi:glycosyltransferase family A protein [Vibrio lentus]|uniref:glycosyltransferase family A protein n=1 Tax=Vibrio lentus TaxID=136468 RepID=UPI000C819633|nr:glycosyltransferase family A protein [Vibrio lentus]PMI85240.1 hypothetical protein BCU36_00965 [Vibrio lentus]